ncbi:MAG: mercuric reductase [Deltaproteobacteria bacterium]|nr:MAG: mercuric reductase [Deltaproteobacteria bacterium]
MQVPPFDDFNRELVGNVHPPDWKNPEPKPRYHLVVIGAGTGGLVTAAGAAGLGARVALVERHLMGGDCLNVGCVPSKGVLRAARAWSEARRAREVFGGPQAEGDGDFGAAMLRMRRLRAGLSPIDSAARFRSLGVDVFLGHGRFADRDTVEVEGARLRFRRAVIATGARAAVPPIPGLEEAGYRTNETIFSLTELPERLLVIGAGPIGCELAQAFARFGSRVTILDQADHVLPREDADAAQVVQAALARDGVEYVSRARIPRVETRGSERTLHVERDGEQRSFRADEILVAVGRAPNVEDLGLADAGVEHSSRGIAVDARLRTSNKRIFAVGDVCSDYKFTHAADAQARLVIANALFFGLGGGRADRLLVPWCTYTSPEVAHVGLYAKEAVAAGHAVDTLTLPLADLDRAVLDGETEGFLRVHLAKGKDEILGATLVAEHAGEMISELTLAMSAGLGLSKVGAAIHPYPTQAEIFRKAADARRRAALTPTVKRIFELVFRVLR